MCFNVLWRNCKEQILQYFINQLSWTDRPLNMVWCYSTGINIDSLEKDAVLMVMMSNTQSMYLTDFTFNISCPVKCLSLENVQMLTVERFQCTRKWLNLHEIKQLTNSCTNKWCFVIFQAMLKPAISEMFYKIFWALLVKFPNSDKFLFFIILLSTQTHKPLNQSVYCRLPSLYTYWHVIICYLDLTWCFAGSHQSPVMPDKCLSF